MENNRIKEAKEIFKSGDDISIPLIQRGMRESYQKAFELFEEMNKEGLLEIKGFNKPSKMK